MSKLAKTIRNSAVVRLIVGFLLAAVVLTAVGFLASNNYLRPLDQYAVQFVAGLRSPLLSSLFRAVTRLGSTVVLALIGAVLVMIFAWLTWWRAIGLFLIAMAGQAILHHGFKFIFARERPAEFFDYVLNDRSFSFPSGHAVASLTFYCIVAWLISHRLETPAAKFMLAAGAFIIVILIGTSRVYFNVHHASDVLGGFVAAAIWTFAVASCDDREPT